MRCVGALVGFASIARLATSLLEFALARSLHSESGLFVGPATIVLSI